MVLFSLFISPRGVPALPAQLFLLELGVMNDTDNRKHSRQEMFHGSFGPVSADNFFFNQLWGFVFALHVALDVLTLRSNSDLFQGKQRGLPFMTQCVPMKHGSCTIKVYFIYISLRAFAENF
eukprot:EG_transcript_22542